MGQVTETSGTSRQLSQPIAMKKRYVYSKNFLLSFADLEHCKRLPENLDHSLLRDVSSELADGGIAIPAAAPRSFLRGNRERDAHSESPPELPEWRRPSGHQGSSFLQPAGRQADNHSSSKHGPGRGEHASSRNSERSGPNRWEPRGNGSEREKTRPRRDWDSTESGGRFQGGAYSRSGVVAQEHDGLLGSGGPLVQRNILQTRTHERQNNMPGRTSRMGRGNEQYHPVRGGKAANRPRKEDSDSINDETFGYEERSNDERAEQERRRRDSFEQMRKEQMKKGTELTRNQDDNWMWDAGQNNDALLSSSPGTPQSSSSKDDAFKTQSRPVSAVSTPRLAVPPGFSKPALQKKEIVEVSKTLSNIENEILKQVALEENIGHETKVQENLESNDDSSSQYQVPLASKFARWFPVQAEVSSQDTNGDNTDSVWSTDNKHISEGTDFSHKEDAAVKPVNLFLSNDSFEANGSSLIDKLDLSRQLCLDEKSGSMNCLVHGKSQGSVLPMPNAPSLEDVERVMTAGVNNDLMANTIPNIASKEQNVTPNPVSVDHFFSPTSSSEFNVNGLLFNSKKDRSPNSVPFDTMLPLDMTHSNRDTLLPDSSFKGSSQQKVPPVFLTCEDLEQSLLAETTPVEKCKNMQEGFLGESVFEQETNTDGDIAGNASQQIMSLLQRSKEVAQPEHSEDVDGFILADPAVSIPGHDRKVTISGHDRQITIPGHNYKAPEETSVQACEAISVEALFGKAFANELRSVGEPVSSKVMDGSVNVADVLQSSRKTGQVNIGKGGWISKLQPPEAFYERDLLNSLEPELRNGMWPETASHAHGQIETLNDFEKTSTTISLGPFLKDIGQPNVPHFPYSQHPEGLYVPTPHLPPHGKPLEHVPETHFIHDGAVPGMGSYPSNGPLHAPHGLDFIRGQFGERLDGHAVKAPHKIPAVFDSAYLESMQMQNHEMPGPAVGSLGINPSDNKWFPGDPGHGSHGVPGFAHQYPNVLPERHTDYGGFGLGGNGPTMGPPLDKLSYLERMQFPYGPGFDGYAHALPDYRPRFH